jgi:WD40 repeat protein
MMIRRLFGLILVLLVGLVVAQSDINLDDLVVKEVISFPGFTQDVEFSPDGTVVATRGDDGSIQLWDVKTGSIVKELTDSEHIVNRFAFNIDGRFIAGASEDSVIRVWETKTGKEVMKFVGHTDRILKIRFGLDRRTIATSSADKTLRIWAISSGSEIRRFEGHTEAVRDFNYSPNGLHVATVSTDKTVRLWELESGRAIRSFSHPDDVYSVDFHPDTLSMVTGSSEVVRIWDIKTGNLVRQFSNLAIQSSGMWRADFTSDGQRIRLAYDSRITYIDAVNGRLLETILFPISATSFSTYLSDNTKLLAIVRQNIDPKAFIWDIEKGKKLFEIGLHDTFINNAAISPNNRYLVGEARSRTHIWDWKTNSILKSFWSGVVRAWVIKFSPDSSVFAVGGFGDMKIFKSENGQEIQQLKSEKDFYDIAFHPNNKWLLAGNLDGTARLIDINSGVEIRRFQSDDSIAGVAISPDGQKIATSGRSVRVWDINSGTELLRIPHEPVIDVEFSPDGQLIATGGWTDKTVRLWNATTGKELRVFQGRESDIQVNRIKFSPDGLILVSNTSIPNIGISKREVRLWNVGSGVLIKTFVTGALGMDLSADGKQLILAGLGATIYTSSTNTPIFLRQQATATPTTPQVTQPPPTQQPTPTPPQTQQPPAQTPPTNTTSTATTNLPDVQAQQKIIRALYDKDKITIDQADALIVIIKENKHFPDLINFLTAKLEEAVFLRRLYEGLYERFNVPGGKP